MNPFVIFSPLLYLLNIVKFQAFTFNQLEAENVRPTAVFLVDVDSLSDDVIKRDSTNFTGTIEVVKYYMSDNTTFSGNIEFENISYDETTQAICAVVDQVEQNKISGSLYAYFNHRAQEKAHRDGNSNSNSSLKAVIKYGIKGGYNSLIRFLLI